ncbi:MAG: hypothetical protein K1X87_05235 [Dehalococcoidia bacterium]|nr:hypothetical protein [Dehalococcoidia bacterium]
MLESWLRSAGALVLASLLVACGAIEDRQPARNPLAETPLSSTAVASVTRGASATPTASAGPGTRPPDAGAEIAVGRATEAMALWLDVPQRTLTPRLVEAVEWSDSCLGVQQPPLCAQVVTPGYRIRLEDALGATHTVHVEARSGRTVWVGEVTLQATVISVDATARRATVQADGQTVTLRLAPGTRWFPEDGEARATGKPAHVAYDPAVAPGTSGTAAWIALDRS